MPCCAFAVFLVSQVLLGLAAVKRVVVGRGAGSDAAQRNATVEWRLGQAVPLACRPPRRAIARTFVLVAVLEGALVVGGIYAARAHFGGVETGNGAAHASPLCSSH